MKPNQLADIAAGNVIDHQYPNDNTRPLYEAPDHVQDAIANEPTESDVQAALNAAQGHQ